MTAIAPARLQVGGRVDEDHIRLPESIPDSRLAPLDSPPLWRMLIGLPIPLLLDSLNRHSVLYRSLISNPGSQLPIDERRVYARDLEVPSGGGVGSARAIAHAYGALAAGGAELDMRDETIRALEAPPVPPLRGFHDECLKGEVAFSLGFMKPGAAWPFGGPRAFGAPRAGGSLGFADPASGIGYGYVTNRMGPRSSATRATWR